MIKAADFSGRLPAEAGIRLFPAPGTQRRRSRKQRTFINQRKTTFVAYIPRKPLELTVPAMCAGKKGSLAAAADASPDALLPLTPKTTPYKIPAQVVRCIHRMRKVVFRLTENKAFLDDVPEERMQEILNDPGFQERLKRSIEEGKRRQAELKRKLEKSEQIQSDVQTASSSLATKAAEEKRPGIPMYLEKENRNTKWFKQDELKIKLVNRGTESDVFAALKGYNLCFKLVLFDFVKHVKEDLLLDVLIRKTVNGQKAFMIPSDYALELVNYIPAFVKEWNIKINPATVFQADALTEEVWYDAPYSR